VRVSEEEDNGVRQAANGIMQIMGDSGKLLGIETTIRVYDETLID